MCILSRLWLRVTRSLARGGGHEFVVFLLVCAVFWGLFCLAIVLSGVPVEYLDQGNFYADNVASGAFYHLFTSGGQNVLDLPGSWLISIFGIFMVAALTSLFANFVSVIGQRYLEGKTHYRVKKHVAVFGYHEMLPGLLKKMLETDHKESYFLIETSHVSKARRELSQSLSRKQMNKIILQAGDIVSPVKSYMHIGDAEEIIILGEEMTIGADSAHDTAVLTCLKNIVDFIPVSQERGQKILCQVMFEHYSTFAVFQHTDLNLKVFEKMAFMPFNYYELWARKVLVNDSLTPVKTKETPYLPLEGTKGIGADSEDRVHFVVIGMSRMGVAMGLQAAHMGHYPNYINNPSCKTRITFIDLNAKNEMYHLQGRMEAMFQTASWRYIDALEEDYAYSKIRIEDVRWLNPLTDSDSTSPYKSASGHLGKDFIDIEWEFIKGDVENPSVQDYLGRAASDQHSRFTVAVCVPDSNSAVAIGLNLPASVYQNAVQVLIYQRAGDSIVSTLSSGTVAGYSPYSCLQAFGMSSDSYDAELIKKLVFVARKKYDEGSPSLREMLVADAYNEMAQASSSKAAAANMSSKFYNSSNMWTKLRSVGSTDGTFPEDSIEIMSRTEHIRWNVEQLLTQFRPLTEQEQNDFTSGVITKSDLKRKRLAHPDICSRERLEVIDPKTVKHDYKYTEVIPKLYEKLHNE